MKKPEMWHLWLVSELAEVKLSPPLPHLPTHLN